MDPASKKRIEEALNRAGSQLWSSLVDMFDDAEFPSILSDQEKQIFQQVKQDPNSVSGYRHIFVDVVSKYISWKVYKDTKLKDVNARLKKVADDIDTYQEKLDTISKTAEYIGGATVLVEYSKAFKDTSKEHADAANKQQRYYTISIGLFILLIFITFFFSITDMKMIKNIIADDLQLVTLGTGFLVIKIMILFFFYQIALFYKRNYNAEKHLQEVYKHRSDVLQSLHAVYSAISSNEERDKILSMGVLFAYERGETGYITTKEGAGSTDNLVEGIFTKLLNK